MEVQNKGNGMSKEKRKKSKMLQFRVIPEDFKVFEETAKNKNLSKTELFELFLELLKEEKI